MNHFRRLFHWSTVSREKGWCFTLPCALAYLAFLSWGHSVHEPWRDEIHPWIVARGADGFWDIATGDRIYDGHPPGWFWYLRLWSWLTDELWGLHAATVATMSAAALLFLRYAPFPRLLRVLLLASYLLGYEYGIISRNYSLGVLFVFAFCALYHPLKPRLVGLSCVLGLLALTSVYGVIMAGCLFLFVLAKGSAIGRSTLGPRVVELRILPLLVVGGGICAASIGLAYFTSNPADPNPFAPAWNFAALGTNAFELTAKRLVYTFLPVRGFGDFHYWWNIEYFWSAHPQALTAVASGLALALVAALVPHWTALLAFVCGTVLFAVVQLARYPGGMRHLGHYFILFIAVCWLVRAQSPRTRSWAMMLVMLVAGGFQFRSLVVAAYRDSVQAFAGSGAIADRIEREGLNRLPIVAGPDGGALSIMGRLNQPFISCETEELNQTIVFHGRRVPFSTAGLLDKAVAVSQQNRAPVLVVSMYPLELRAPAVHTLEFLFTNEEPALEENYFVYRLTASVPRER